MKQVTNMSRLVNQLEKMFRTLNTDMFNGELAMPVITVIPTARAYAHYTPWNAWRAGEEDRREINISSSTLDRPLEDICSSLLHEMVHMYDDTILGVKDTSREGTYHSKRFAESAEAHGLICTRTEKYGYSHTEPSDQLLEWVLLHDEFREIEMCRVDLSSAIGTGKRSAEGGIKKPLPPKSNSRRYVCPECGTIVRATKEVRIICADCLKMMVEG